MFPLFDVLQIKGGGTTDYPLTMTDISINTSFHIMTISSVWCHYQWSYLVWCVETFSFHSLREPDFQIWVVACCVYKSSPSVTTHVDTVNVSQQLVTNKPISWRYSDKTPSSLQTQSSSTMWFKASSIPPPRPPVNVTCNIFINSLGSVTETTTVSPLASRLISVNVSMCYLSLNPAGPPVNVTCNIFINSFGSIAETTMVSWARSCWSFWVTTENIHFFTFCHFLSVHSQQDFVFFLPSSRTIGGSRRHTDNINWRNALWLPQIMIAFCSHDAPRTRISPS